MYVSKVHRDTYLFILIMLHSGLGNKAGAEEVEVAGVR